MAPGLISAAALAVLAQHAAAFSVNGFAGTSVRSQTARASSTATPSMVAVSPNKPMTREQKRKEERLDQERRRKYVTPEEQYADTPLSTSTTEHLIGEEMVDDDVSASALADRCIAEAERLFASDEGWTKVLEEDGIFVESKDIHGPYLKSGVRVVRGLGAIEADADKFYDFQVSRTPGGRMRACEAGREGGRIECSDCYGTWAVCRDVDVRVGMVGMPFHFLAPWVWVSCFRVQTCIISRTARYPACCSQQAFAPSLS